MVYSTMLGGTGLDHAMALALDAQGVATVAGNTNSADFPTTPGAFDTSHNGRLGATLRPPPLPQQEQRLLFQAGSGAVDQVHDPAHLGVA